MTPADDRAPTPASDAPAPPRDGVTPESLEAAGWVRPGFTGALLSVSNLKGRKLTPAEYAAMLDEWRPTPEATPPRASSFSAEGFHDYREAREEAAREASTAPGRPLLERLTLVADNLNEFWCEQQAQTWAARDETIVREAIATVAALTAELARTLEGWKAASAALAQESELAAIRLERAEQAEAELAASRPLAGAAPPEPDWLTAIREFYVEADAPTDGPFRHHHENVHRLLRHVASLERAVTGGIDHYKGLEARLRDAERRERELRLAGLPLANAAYNLAQSDTLTEGVRSSLRAGYTRWDDTTLAHAIAAADAAAARGAPGQEPPP